MIFLVDHDAERLPAIHDDCAACTFGGVLAADQMAARPAPVSPKRKGPAAILKTNPAFLESFSTCGLISSRIAVPLGFLRPTGKSAIAQIAREPDATADYDLMMRSFAAEPLSGVRHDIRKFHRPYPASSLSSCLIWSRNDAAVS